MKTGNTVIEFEGAFGRCVIKLTIPVLTEHFLKLNLSFLPLRRVFFVFLILYLIALGAFAPLLGLERTTVFSVSVAELK
jgi:hypothetical protein